MSLAMNAAPFNNVDMGSMIQSQPMNVDRDSRRRNNKTVKLRGAGGSNKISSENVNSVIANIHGGSNYESTDSGDLGEFVPIAPPTSVGVEQTKIRSELEDSSAESSHAEYDPANIRGYEVPTIPMSSNSDGYDKYRQYMPDYKKMYGDEVDADDLVGGSNSAKGVYASIPIDKNNSSLQQAMISNSKNGGDILLNKLNYVIHLLEEQQDDKTAHVTEEIALYLFLGVFVIFIVDSFTRLVKYTR